MGFGTKQMGPSSKMSHQTNMVEDLPSASISSAEGSSVIQEIFTYLPGLRTGVATTPSAQRPQPRRNARARTVFSKAFVHFQNAIAARKNAELLGGSSVWVSAVSGSR